MFIDFSLIIKLVVIEHHSNKEIMSQDK